MVIKPLIALLLLACAHPARAQEIAVKSEWNEGDVFAAQLRRK